MAGLKIKIKKILMMVFVLAVAQFPVFYIYAEVNTETKTSDPLPVKSKQPAQTTLQEIQVKGAASSGKSAGVGTKTNTPLRNVPASIAVVPKEIVELQEELQMWIRPLRMSAVSRKAAVVITVFLIIISFAD